MVVATEWRRHALWLEGRVAVKQNDLEAAYYELVRIVGVT